MEIASIGAAVIAPHAPHPELRRIKGAKERLVGVVSSLESALSLGEALGPAEVAWLRQTGEDLLSLLARVAQQAEAPRPEGAAAPGAGVLLWGKSRPPAAPPPTRPVDERRAQAREDRWSEPREERQAEPPGEQMQPDLTVAPEEAEPHAAASFEEEALAAVVPYEPEAVRRCRRERPKVRAAATGPATFDPWDDDWERKESARILAAAEAGEPMESLSFRPRPSPPAPAAPLPEDPPLAAHLLPDDGHPYDPVPLPPYEPPGELPADLGHGAHKAPLVRLAAISCATGLPEQFGLMGERVRYGQPVGIAIAPGKALGFVGAPGFGKSYAMGVIVEMALSQILSVNKLDRPLCAVVMHHHQSASYEPELLSSVYPNCDPTEAGRLKQEYRALPKGVRDVVVLTLPEQVARLRKRHRHAQVHGIRFALRDLGHGGLRALLGIDGAEAPLYVRQMEALLKRLLPLGPALTWQRLLEEAKALPMERRVRDLLDARLALVADWIDDGRRLRSLLRPGRLVLVDIRDEWMGAEQAMTLFSLLTDVLIMHPDRARETGCDLLVVYDEAHKFLRTRTGRRQLETMVRERRHLGLFVLIGSQDPVSIPGVILGQLDAVGVFCHESAAWARHLSQAVAALGQIKVDMTAQLPPGHMWWWSREWGMFDRTCGDFHGRVLLLETRPRASHHGGTTKSAAGP